MVAFLNNIHNIPLDDLAYEFGRRLENAGWIVGTAESCTGGLIARALTERAGSSAWFDRSVVTYSNEAKTTLLGVPLLVLQESGAVSEPCAAKMASGLLAQFVSKPAIAISVTGIAGPTGAVPGKPVGTVCFGCALRAADGHERIETTTKYFDGSRSEVRLKAAVFALEFAMHLFEATGFGQATQIA
jgi:nicotinamide-nucleotide amidase